VLLNLLLRFVLLPLELFKSFGVFILLSPLKPLSHAFVDEKLLP